MTSDNPLLPNDEQENAVNELPAADLIRAKLRRIYNEEPDASEELNEAVAATPKQLSPHQEYMLELKNSGKSIAQIQTDWHNYYQSLSDNDKRQVWQEFYSQQASAAAHPLAHWSIANTSSQAPSSTDSDVSTTSDENNENQAVVSERLLPEAAQKPIARRARRVAPKRAAATKKLAEIRQSIKAKTAAREQFERKQLRAKHNLQSLAFGLGVGVFVVLIFMFSFFNQRFIVPFISPGEASATPIILNPDAPAPTSQPEIIIPKINLEIPLVFSAQSTNENDIETALESGVVHYPTTVLPGQMGNSAFFGHSSNNIFSPGQYKFAFALLDKLSVGDTFYITYNKKVYVYKVYDRQIVDPSDVAVLDNVPGKAATATLITCDPPGTSLNRLVVWGEQISPNPDTNAETAAPAAQAKPKQIVGNGPSLLSRIWPF